MAEITDNRKRENEHCPLAIIGIGCLFPKAAGPGFYWANIKHAVDCIGPVPSTHWHPDDYFDPDPKSPDMTYARRGGFLDPIDFNPLEFGIAPRDIEATDTTQLLGLVAAKQALTDAGVVFANATTGVGDRESEIGKHQSGVEEQGAGNETAKTRHPIRDTRRLDERRPIHRDRVSVILGVTGTLELVIPLGARLGHPKWKRAMKEAGIPDEAAADAAARIAESYVPWQENSFPGLLGNVVAGRIANKLDLGGTNCVVDAACASSLSAVHLAALELQTGKADVVVTGGADTFNDIFMFMCFSKTPALSPTGDAKPFDANGDGTILGEGLGLVVLKRLADAERDGDTIYAVLRGIGSSSDGKGNAIYAPSAAGQKKCLLNAYRNAGVTPDTIELVEAHGTGTKVGDTVEITALTAVYSSPNAVLSEDATTTLPLATENGKPKAVPWCAIGSVKSQVGHTKAAAGAASLIKAALALYNKVLPPTAKVNLPVEPLRAADSPFYVNTIMRPWLPRPEHPRRAALSAFGFGGSNFHAVLEEYQPQKLVPDWDGRVELVTLGADTRDQLRTRLDAIPTSDWLAFARFAETSRAEFVCSAPYRLCFAAHRTHTDLPKLMANARAQLAASPNATTWHTSEGVHFGAGDPVGKLAVLFPGQGSQSLGMLRELTCLFPEMLDTLTEANSVIPPGTADGRRLSDRIYPPTTFDPARQDQDDRELRDTRNAQPALGAVSLGAWRVLHDRFGVNADAFAGHSYGELTALAASGRIASTDFFTLSRTRGELMARQRNGDPGSMLAVLAERETIEKAITQHGLNVVVANHNSPKQTVISGATTAIEQAETVLRAAGMRSARLPVAAAFHSEYVADAAEPFRATLESVNVTPTSISVYANTTAAPYPEDANAAKDLLANQLARPVAFVDEIRALAAAGVRIFFEVGPGAVLTRLVQDILAGSDVSTIDAFALDASGGKRSCVLDFSNALARLAAAGVKIRPEAWEAESRCRPTLSTAKPGLTITLSGANYVAPRTPRPPRIIPSHGSTCHPNSLAQVSSMSEPARAPADANSLTQALLMTQQTFAALQRMQEQTAQLHRQFLESQEAAQRTLQTLVEQQQALLGLGVAPRPTLAAVPSVAAPIPQLTVPQPMPAPTPIPVTATTPTIPVAPPKSAPQSVPPPRPSAAAPVPAPRAAAPSTNHIATTLLAVVAEKTGYPPESLDLKLSLDADLGVDSIKRVEILAALREKLPNAPEVKPEHLGTLHTLQDVANYLSGGSPASNGVADDEELTRTMPVSREQLILLARGDDPAKARPSPSATPDVASTLLAVVAEKTGYPPESLDLKLSLDADLGVDSIKRVEILSALKEKLPGAPEVKPEHLGTLYTLQDLANFLSGRPGGSEQAFPATTRLSGVPNLDAILAADVPPTLPPGAVTPVLPTPSLSELAAPDTEHLSKIKPVRPQSSSLIPPAQGPAPRPGTPSQVAPPPPRTLQSATQVVETQRAPLMPLGPDRIDRSILQVIDLDLHAPRTRVPLAPGSEFLVVGDPDGLTEHIADRLAQNGFSARVVGWDAPGLNHTTTPLAGLVLVAPLHAGPDSGLNRLAFEWLQIAGPKLRQSGRQSAAILATVARFDGAFGLGELSPEADPTVGGLAGIVKTARHEWPELTVKAIDLSPDFDELDAAAAAVVDEVLTAGPLEVGIARNHRCTLEMARTVRRVSTQTLNLGVKDVVLVTGGARGVTAEATCALAEAFGATMILTGRTPAPGPEPEWLAGLHTEADLKRAIAERLGTSAGPAQIREQYQKIINQREIRLTLKRIEELGAKAAYYPVDAADGRAVADMLQQVRVKYGPLTAIVHGAGVLADRRIEDLTLDDFDRVYSTKVEGLRNLLELLAHEELKAIVLFSSTTGRFGRTGQLAYAVANEVLNKWAQVEARRRPGCRVVAINWGPWEGGMVTPGLRKQFDSEGIGLIPLHDGALFVVQELNAAGKAVEVIALGKQRITGSGQHGLSGSGLAITPAPHASSGIHSSLGVVSPPNAATTLELALAFERTIDIDSHPILRSHVLDGKAVLPMALHLELLAHAALHGNPGLVFHGFNDLRITQGVTIDGGSSAQLKAFAGKAIKQDKLFLVPVELRGKRKDGREAIKSRAEIVLTAALPKAPIADRPPLVRPVPLEIEHAYRDVLFHGPELHGIERIEGASENAFVGVALTAPPPADWFQYPLRSSWVADPLVLDVSFQMMILWSMTHHQTESLPNYAGRYRQFRRTFPTGSVTIVIRVTRDDGKFARADIDYLDADGNVIAQMQDYECMMESSLHQAFRRNQIGMVKA